MVTAVYKNWQNKSRTRVIIPEYLYWGTSQWHPKPGWLLRALDAVEQRVKDFALCGFASPVLPAVIFSVDYDEDGMTRNELFVRAHTVVHEAEGNVFVAGTDGRVRWLDPMYYGELYMSYTAAVAATKERQ